MVQADANSTGPQSRIRVFGPGCRKCETLYERTCEAVREMGRGDLSVEHVKDVDAIAAFGPILTPALVIGDKLVLSGRLPARASLERLLAEHLGE